MIEITLTKGQVALIDDDMLDRVSYFKWFALYKKRKNGPSYYARTNIYIGKKRYTLLMHHLILGLPENTVQVDHKNANGIDNRRDNLRTCTNAQNQWNQTKVSGKKSKYKGVYYLVRNNAYMVIVTKGRVRHYLGLFSSESDAAIRYNQEAVKLFGEFARLNVIDLQQEGLLDRTDRKYQGHACGILFPH